MASAAGAWFVSRYGHHLDLLDKPNERSSHLGLTPRGGGLGILAAFVIAAVCLGLPVLFWLPAGLLAVISFIGDRIELSPILRLLFQFTAAIIFLLGCWKAAVQPAFDYLMVLPFAVFIVATANYYNFMDGINGIAGITGVVGFGLLAVFAQTRGVDARIMLLSICLSLGCLGFLPFNMPRGRVFMGDVGSILLGFVFAALVIWLSKGLSDFICLASFIFPFFADEVTTEIVRLKDGEKLWRPHRRHLYQLLANEYRLPHWQVSIGYGSAQLIIGISILIISSSGLVPVLSSVVFYFLIFALLSSTLRRRLVQNR